MTAKPKPVTSLEAKEVWENTPKPSARKVADRFKAAGRKVSFKTIAKWKRENWGISPEKVEAAAAKAAETIDNAAVVVTRDPSAKAADAPVLIPALDPDTPTSKETEDALRDTIHGARNMVAIMQADAVEQMKTPHIAGKFFVDIAAALAGCVDSLTKMPVIRAGEMQTVNGTQEVLAAEVNHPLRASIEAFRQESQRIRDAAATKN